MIKTIRTWTKSAIFEVLDQREKRSHQLMYDLQRWTLGKSVEIIFDVGANVGQTVSRFKRYFPNAQVEAFEPVRNPFKDLNRRSEDFEKVHCHPFALGESDEVKKICLEQDSRHNSLSNEVADNFDGPTEKISVRTLDSFCKEKRFRHVDVLKTGTEGHDLAVLKGGGSFCENREWISFCRRLVFIRQMIHILLSTR
jgi:FkbM family methyltransferase